MEKYKIEIKKSAVKEIKDLPSPYLINIVDKISSLSNNPRPEGSTKLFSEEKYRLRIGRYRVIYEIKDKLKSVIIYKVSHRKDVYRK
ncbi:MAG: type II toxin-antitoxin system RelE/ParE family toxin [Ignavibacteriaceae bacterium]